MTSHIVSSGQVSSGVVLNAGDQEIVMSGGIALATSLTGGNAMLIVSAGGMASGTTVDATGGVVVVLGGTVSDTSFAGRGLIEIGTEVGSIVGAPGGLALNTSLGSGASMLLGTSAIASGTRVGAAATLSNTDGMLANTTVESGGFEYDTIGASTFATAVDGGGEQFAAFGAVTTGTIIGSGGYEVVSAATASGTHVLAGGTLLLLPGASAVDTFLETGGRVQSGGVVELAQQRVVSAFVGAQSGGQINGVSAFVLSGGGLNGVLITATTLQVYAGGTTEAATLADGSYEQVRSGAAAHDTRVGWGTSVSGGDIVAGTLAVMSGGSAFDTTLLAPGSGISLGKAVLEVASGATVSHTIVSSGGELQLFGDAQPLATQVLDGGQIDLAAVAYDAAGSATLDAGSDTLSITEHGQTTTLALTGSYVGEYFHLAADSGSGTLITVDGTPCYCHGTNILTDAGDVPVEQLRIGDRLITVSGAARPLRWIGRRSYSGRFAAGNRDVLPVCFRAGSLGEGLPRRDLHVSPLHAMLLDGVLIPAAALVDGVTIVQAASVGEVCYVHLELDSHDVILAEGAPSETYLDDDNRGMFHNAADHAAECPAPAARAAHADSGYCAPRVDSGPRLLAVRRRLAGSPPPIAHGPLTGVIDTITRGRVTGWAIDGAAPAERQRLRVLIDGVVAGVTLADRFRDDLLEAGLHDGRCGFSFVIDAGLTPGRRHVVQVERADDRAPLHGSPAVFDCPELAPAATIGPIRGRLDAATRDRIAGWADDPSQPGEKVALQVLDNGVPIARVLANGFRADLAEAGIGGGWCGFEVTLPAGLPPHQRHVIEVRSDDGASLPGSPTVIAAANSFDPALQVAIEAAVAGLDGEAEHARVFAFLTGQADRVLQARANAEIGRTARPAGTGPRRSRQRALVIDPRYPDPDRDAGSAALLSHMRALRRLGYEVSFVAADEMRRDDPALTAAGVACCHAPFYTSVEDVLRRQAGGCDVIYLHRAPVAAAYLALARQHHPRAKILFAVADLHHLRLLRQAEIEQRPDLLAHSREARLAECTAAWLADTVLTHTEVEAAILRAAVPGARVHVAPWDIAHRPLRTAFARRDRVLFVGNYQHAPNRDAARFLVFEVMPLVWRDDPGIGCILAGSAMPAELAALAGTRVLTPGHVPDLQALFGAVRLSVAPLRFGAGLKGKVLDSLAAGVPCVMTDIAAEGFALPPALRALVASDPVAMAAAIVRLHQNAAAHRDASRAGLAVVAAGFQPRHVDQALRQAIGGRLQAAA